MTIIGYDFWGINCFESVSPPVIDITRIELSNAVYDEVHLRDRTDISSSPTKEDWQFDTRLLAQFKGDLEAGNINNSGIQIEKFAIKRRKVNEVRNTTLGYTDFVNNHEFTYKDYTQPNDIFIYSIVPIGENGLEGQENPIEIKSDFAGWFLVDKENNEVLSFDKFFDNNPHVSNTLNQNRVQIDTLSRFPQFYRTPQRYHSFSLKGLIIPENTDRSGHLYNTILEKFVYNYKPFLVKGSNGENYVVEVSQPQSSSPQNSYNGFDYLDLTLNFTEIMTYEDFMEE